jgi:protein-disulfide isomerase
VLEKYPKETKFVVKQFPLRSHRFARKAAAAALAANEQGKFWEFHEKLIENHSSIDEKKIQDIATELHLNMEQFTRDMNSAPVNDLIVRDLRDGRAVGIRGIPTVLVNGRIVAKPSPQNLEGAIAAALNKSRAK